MKKRVIEWMSSKNLYIIFCSIAILLAVYSYYTYSTYIVPSSKREITPSIQVNNGNKNEELLNYNGQIEVEQSFICDAKGMSKIEIGIDKNDGLVQGLIISLMDDKGNLIQKWERVKLKNKKVICNLDKEISINRQQVFVIKIIYNAFNKENIFLFTNEDEYYNGQCNINGQALTGDIEFSVYPCRGDYRFIKTVFLFLIVYLFIGLFALFFSVVSKYKFKLETLFVICMFFLGPVMLYILPAFSAPDEPVHFAAAYRISNNLLGVEDDKNTDYAVCRDSDNNMNIYTTPDLNMYKYIYYHTFEKNEEIDNNSNFYTGYVLKGSPLITHFPQALGITLARLLHLSYPALLMLGRLFSLMTYILLVYWSIKIIPFGKKIIFGIACMPMMVEESTCYGYDFIVCGIAFLLIADIIYLIYEKDNIYLKDIIITSVISFTLAPCKMIYFVISFLIILISNKKFRSKLLCLIAKIGIPLISAVIAVAYNASNVSGTSEENYIEWAGEKGYMFSDLLTNIPHTINIVLATIHDKFSFYLNSTIGGALGRLDIEIPMELVVGFVIVLIFCMTESRYRNIRITHRAVYGVIFIFVCGLSCLAMLISWTPISCNSIEGVQGRYFIPGLPLLFLCFSTYNPRITEKTNRNILLALYILNMLVMLRVIEVVVSR